MSEHLDTHVAVIPLEKISNYLLSRDHPVGRFKAQFFEHLGYTRLRGDQLGHDLRQHLADGVVEISGATQFSRKYRVLGPIRRPNEHSAQRSSVWIRLTRESVARFVTAYPGA